MSAGRNVFVYVVDQADGCAVKVGIAADLAKRLKALQCGNPQRLRYHVTVSVRSRNEAEIIERRAHAALRKSRLSGEWFGCGAKTAKAAVMAALTGIEFEIGPSDPFYRGLAVVA